MLDRRGWLHQLFSGRMFMFIFWSLWALITSFFMLLQFHTYDFWEWLIFFTVIPVFYAVYHFCGKLVGSQYKAYLRASVSLQWASRWITPFIMLIFYLLIASYSVQTPEYSSFDDAVLAHKAALAGPRGSALMTEATQWLAWYEGAKAYAIGKAGVHHKIPALFVTVMGKLVLFFNACLMLSIFLIPGREFRRIINPLNDEAIPSEISSKRVMVSMIITVVVIILAYIPLIAGLEQVLQANPQYAETRRHIEESISKQIEAVEIIGKHYVREGTIERIQAAKIEALHKFEISLAKIESESDRAFDRLEGNVDAFLDWYYSLPAEYMRIGKLMVGEIDNYLEDKLFEFLSKGDAFQKFEAALNEAFKANEAALSEYRAAVKQVIAQGRVSERDDKEFRVVQSLTVEEALNPPVFNDKISFGHRMGLSGGGAVIAGTITAIIVKKIIVKLAAKNTIKLAAKAVAKVIATKVGGSATATAIGSFVGGAIGSIWPGPGTVIGALVGGAVIGGVTSITLDKMFLMLEEAISRDDFKRELMDAIEVARVEFKKQLRSE